MITLFAFLIFASKAGAAYEPEFYNNTQFNRMMNFANNGIIYDHYRIDCDDRDKTRKGVTLNSRIPKFSNPDIENRCDNTRVGFGLYTFVMYAYYIDDYTLDHLLHKFLFETWVGERAFKMVQTEIEKDYYLIAK